MTSSAMGGFEQQAGTGPQRSARGCCGAAKRWSVWEVGAMVAGFVAFWPLGLLALFVKYKNGEMWPGSSESKAPWQGFAFKAPDFGRWQSPSYGFASSGNHAFDDYRRDTLKRLEEERRKLDEEHKAFREFVDRVRRAKDQEEFDRYMAERRTADKPSSASK